MADTVEQWLVQADYDLETAEYMLQGERRSYAVFMAHLAVEKALKGLYQRRLGKIPPKVHDLQLLVEKIGLEVSIEQQKFLTSLTQAQIATRYPVDIAKLQRRFSDSVAGTVLTQAGEMIRWIKTLL